MKTLETTSPGMPLHEHLREHARTQPEGTAIAAGLRRGYACRCSTTTGTDHG
ncbi:MAG TPA: hypothetical protein PKB14_14435 [Rubrivivax sp.]|nr:hypothetical protein [Rubrivivax sp.]